MATFPSPPGHRFQYDIDGTVGLQSYLATQATLTSGNLTAMNDEDVDTFATTHTPDASNDGRIHFLFPELRNITGIFYAGFNINTVRLEVSTDTTTGYDGTWTQVLVVAVNGTISPNWRNSIQTVTGASSVKAARLVKRDVSGASQTYCLHLYGSRVTPQALVFWDPTLNQAATAATFDFGDVFQGSTNTKTFRIKNNHATLTAQSISVSATDVSNTMAVQFDIAGTYANPLNIGNLAAGAISNVITMRRIVPGAEVTRPQGVRLSAVPAAMV